MTDHRLSIFLFYFFFFYGHLGHLAPIIPPFGSMAFKNIESHHVCVRCYPER